MSVCQEALLKTPAGRLNVKLSSLTSIRIPIIKERWSDNCLIFIMGIPILQQMQCGQLNILSTCPKTDVLYMFYTKFHLPRSIFYLPSSKCTCIGEQASISFPHCRWSLYWDNAQSTAGIRAIKLMTCQDQAWIDPMLLALGQFHPGSGMLWHVGLK